MTRPTGVAWYIGEPEIGKTSLAVRHLSEDVSRSGYPALVIDSMSARNFRAFPHARTVGEAVARLFDERRHTWYTPENVEDVDRLMRAVVAGWHVHVLIDEAHCWMGSRSLPEGVARAMRGHQHWGGTVRCTSQFYGDVSNEAKSVSPVLYVFRCFDALTLERLQRETRIPAEKIEALEDYRYLVFDRKARPRPPAPPPGGGAESQPLV